MIICTIEKTNQLINKLIEFHQKTDESQLPSSTDEFNSISDIGTIIVDELHMIGEENRGYLLEVTLSKLRYLMSMQKSSIQLIAMSATLPNLREIALWLDACLFVT